jgi:hypothetical protein
MPEVLLTFTDGEVMAARTELIDFHHAVLSVTSVEPGGNNRELTVPLTSLKYIVFGGEEEELDQPLEELGKVVIHFTDHEVMRAYAAKNTLGGPLGIIYTLVDPDRKVRRRIGVPYTSIKAIFKVQRWDSRGRERLLTYDKVAKILARREESARVERAGGKAAPKPRRRPLLERARKA